LVLGSPAYSRKRCEGLVVLEHLADSSRALVADVVIDKAVQWRRKYLEDIGEHPIIKQERKETPDLEEYLESAGSEQTGFLTPDL
jgi:hypothetical protein